MNFILPLESEVYLFLNQTKLILDTRFYQAGDICETEMHSVYTPNL